MPSSKYCGLQNKLFVEDPQHCTLPSIYFLLPSDLPSEDPLHRRFLHHIMLVHWHDCFSLIPKVVKKAAYLPCHFPVLWQKYRWTLRVLSFLHLLCDFAFWPRRSSLNFAIGKRLTFSEVFVAVFWPIIAHPCEVGASFPLLVPSAWVDVVGTQSRLGSFFGSMLRPCSFHTVMKCFGFQNKLMNSSVHMILCFVFFLKRYHAAWCRL